MSVRLGDHVLPIHYRLSLEPDLKAFTFEGKVETLLNVRVLLLRLLLLLLLLWSRSPTCCGRSVR